MPRGVCPCAFRPWYSHGASYTSESAVSGGFDPMSMRTIEPGNDQYEPHTEPSAGLWIVL